MESHIKVLGILYIVLGIMGLIGGLIVLTIFLGSGIVGGVASDEPGITFLIGGFGVIISSVILITSLPGIFAGYGIYKKQSWGRVLGIILGIINLPGIPIGTALGIYALWVLLSEESKLIFTHPNIPSEKH